MLLSSLLKEVIKHRFNKTILHSRDFVPNGFIRKKLYTCLDSSGLPEVHADGGLGDLQVGQTAEVLEHKEGILVWVQSARHDKKKQHLAGKSCMRAPGSERNKRSFKHGKGSHVSLPALSMTWPPKCHDHFRYRTEERDDMFGKIQLITALKCLCVKRHHVLTQEKKKKKHFHQLTDI